jgi:malonate transporter
MEQHVEERGPVGGVLIGFAVVGSIIAAGWVVSRIGLLGEHGGQVLSKTAFTLAFPAFMFSTLATSDLAGLVHPDALVVVLSSVTMMVAFVVVAAIARWGVQRALIGALASSYVNAANLGLPIATYVLGSAEIIPPVLLFQLVLVAPIVLALLDLISSSGGSAWRRFLRPLSNPVVVASLAGVAVNALGLDLPDPVLTPFELVGQATVPLMLLAFGMSLRRNGRPFRNGDTAGIVLAVALKTVAAPLVAVVIGSWVFGFSGKELLAPVLCSALPTAQNVYVYSLRYPGSTALARDAVLLSLIVAVPVLVVFSAVLSNA